MPKRPATALRHPNSTDRQQRNFFSVEIARDALCFRVERPLAVHQKAVVMMAVVELDLKEPGAVRLPFHQVRLRIPVIEIPNDRNVFGFGRVADKVCGAGVVFGGVTVVGNSKRNVRTMHL